MCEVRYEDLPIIFQSEGAVKNEIDDAEWYSIWTLLAVDYGDAQVLSAEIVDSEKK